MARPTVLFLLCSSLLFAVTCALELNGKISWNDVCPDYKQLGRARVVLDDGDLSGSVVKDGSFSISNVSVGTHVLSVLAHDHWFDQLRIDVIDKTTIEVRPYVVGTPLNPPSQVLLAYPITVEAKGKYNYFVPPESFNLMGMLGSPMMLIMILGGAMVLGLPYLMKNMDPEALAELKDQQAKMSQMQNAMTSGDFRGLSALMAAPEDNRQNQPATQSPSTGKAQGGKGRSNKHKKH
ncbi:hypothetical protein K435DRAFT_779253 [Dendrothele bispora CBS 962.96]|uniref:ER membrane protein complex subunit 7 beta-sandwich domain-containing protein n=1 Tax=Dendrothele bispora (strain CBS 962.96) TaxID=1314807 RepID=A0A4S8LZU4_DENBC|nr:hypothetical protein K435DRAFT_779253 [Dendrothele bispora CBS 962.96]